MNEIGKKSGFDPSLSLSLSLSILLVIFPGYSRRERHDRKGAYFRGRRIIY